MSVRPDILKELVELSDGDSWHKADRLVELFPVDEWGEAEEHTKTGLRAELKEYETKLRNQYGVEWPMNSMRIERATSIKWPEEQRCSSTSYSVHRMLRGEDRFSQMQKYLKKAEKEDVALSATRLGRYRADEKGPKPPLPLDEWITKRISSLLKHYLLGSRIVKRNDWWNSGYVSEETRRAVADVLIRFAREFTS